MMRKYFYNEKGGLLVLTLMVFLIFSILGISLLTVSFADVTVSEVDHDTQSAFYIAEAGANEAYVSIKNEIVSMHEHTSSENTYFLKVDDYLNNYWNSNALSNFESNFGDQPEATISINQINSSPVTYELTSKGKIDERERMVTKSFTVSWNKRPSLNLPEGMAGVFKSNVKLRGGGKINGDVQIAEATVGSIDMAEDNGNITGKAFVPESVVDTVFDGVHYIDIEVAPLQEEVDWSQFEAFIDEFPNEFPNYAFPENEEITKNTNSHHLIDNGNLNINSYIVKDHILELTENVKFANITVRENINFHIDTKGNDIDIVVDHLNLANGHLNIEGGGSINLYVKDKISFGADSTFNQNGETSQLNIFYKGSESITMGGSQHLNGSLFAKQADLTLTAGGSYKGYILTGGAHITLSGGNFAEALIFAPFAKLEARAGATVNGMVLADDFLGDGGMNITHKHIDMEDFPFGSGSNGTGDNIVDSDPITEIQN